ncbi:MAG TPA: DinB family protein [Bryobacteraceae bacterium]|jgi:uncharacterized damage-inducible protein DinB
MTGTAKTHTESKTAKSIAAELQREAGTTRRVLERVPADKLTWKPHAKSMTLGQLANHIALIPGQLSQIAQVDVFDASNAKFIPPQPESVQELLATLDTGVKSAEEFAGGLSDSALDAPWRMVAGGKEIMSMPRVDFMRAILLNHWYHHRGQLSVYLRLLDVAIPSIYGPSADENPFI